MSTTVFEQEKSVFFAMDENDAVSQAGGCTQAWWDGQCPNGTEAEAAVAMAKLLDSTGTPLVDVSGVAYDDSEDEITITGAAAAGVEVGMVAYVIESGAPDTDVATGRYKITDVGTDTIQCSGIDGTGSTNVDVVIGGAFEFLQDALDETDATYHSVALYVKSVATLTASIDIDVGGGNNIRNTFKRVVGFNTSPGDMDFGGTYYQSPYAILKAGSIDNTKAVLLDGDGLNVSAFDAAIDNVIFENFHCYNTGTANLITFTGMPQNIVFRNCRFSSGAFVYQAIATSVLVDSCYSHSDLTGNHYQMSGNANVILNCVGNVAASKIFVVVATVEGSQVVGCLAVNGARGIRIYSYEVTAVNNTFYNQTSYGIDITGGLRAIAYNNIFDLYPAAIAFSITTAGTMLYNDYNCFIESDGTPLTVGSHESGYEVPGKGKHSVQVDPDFVDAANGDFRARNPLLLRGGKPGPDGRAAVIGAIGQEYQFAARARMVNQGRVGSTM